MATYTRTLSFNTSRGVFKSDEDDDVVNGILDYLRSRGAQILSIDTHFAAADQGYTLVYVVQYEAVESIR
jgi:hypothetical protein